MTFDKRTIKIICLIVGGAVVLAWLLNNLSAVGGVLAFLWGLVFPFILGFVLAFVLNIPMQAIEAALFKKRPLSRAARPVSFGLTLLLLVGLVALLVLLVVPQLWDTLMTLAAAMPGYLARLEKTLAPYLADLPIDDWLDSLAANWQGLLEKFGDVLQSGAGNLLSSVVNTATSIVGAFVSFFVGVIFACYLLLDKEHLAAQFKGLLIAYLPKAQYDKLVDLARLAGTTYTRFVGSQLLEGAMVTAIYLVLLLVFQFSYPLLIAVIMGVAAIIPMVGPPIGGAIGGLLLLAAMGPLRALLFVVMVLIVQQIEGNILYPKVAGSSLGLPPIWIMVAVMLGGGIAGIAGMLFFIPLFSVVYTLVYRNAKKQLEKKGLSSPVDELPTRPPKKRREKHRKNTK